MIEPKKSLSRDESTTMPSVGAVHDHQTDRVTEPGSPASTVASVSDATAVTFVPESKLRSANKSFCGAAEKLVMQTSQNSTVTMANACGYRLGLHIPKDSRSIA